MLTPLLDPISVVALRSTVSIIVGVPADGITCKQYKLERPSAARESAHQ